MQWEPSIVKWVQVSDTKWEPLRYLFPVPAPETGKVERFSILPFPNKPQYINNSFIAESIPKHPFPVRPLNRSAQRIIGIPNDNAIPALKMMESQNFKPNGLVDIIDAGPCLDCKLNEIKTIKNNRSVKIKSFGLPEKQYTGLVSNTDLKGFRVVRSDFSFDGEKVSVHRNLVKTLKLGTNSKVAINV